MEDSIIKLKYFIENNYGRLKNISKIIAKNEHLANDLLQESILSIYHMKRCPENIFDNKREIQYLYGILIRTYYSKVFQDKYCINDVNFIDTFSDEHTEIYEQIYHKLIDMQMNNEIELYDLKVFLLYYYPEYSIHHIKLSEEKYLLINKKQTYRLIGEITDINYQSIRWTVLKVMKKLKKHIKKK